ncbi:MAG TPA: V-type ATPase 116kDa subunit family protein [Treponemataceae bacterium]|jgi:V/A-type H+-transporting ATPase subunit I|nr:V-type ATPase 116kDa subunit family protein [Treponemataceae bacterium]
MLKTTAMKLVELMILRQDVDRVLEYLGKRANFEIQGEVDYSGLPRDASRDAALERLKACRVYLGLPEPLEFSKAVSIPTERDAEAAARLADACEEIKKREVEAAERQKRVSGAYDEARAFTNLKVAYSELEHLTFLSLRIGKIDPSVFDELRFALGDRAVVVALGDDRTRVLAAASKKGRFALDTELKRFGFVPIEVPKDFKGVPDDVLAGLKAQVDEAARGFDEIAAERKRFAHARGAELLRLVETFALGSQVGEVRESLESTQLVYRVRGWIAADDAVALMKDLDEMTEGRVAIRVYDPGEVPSVKSGKEKVPVSYRHGAFVKSFERMIFSYGAPLYGTIDPTPIVAFFFTLLFGIMFGDVGQGLVFLLLGVSLVTGFARPLARWRHFGPIFIAIGCSSSVMGLLTGEFFANGELLVPFSEWVTGLFGEPRERILELMPSREAMGKLMIFFGFTLAIGFVVNSIGLVINIVNQFALGRPAKAIFSKTGLCGAIFFWYVVGAVARVAVAGGGLRWYDAVAVGVPLLGLFFAEPLTRLIEGHRPVLENGLFSAFIEGIVELLEVVSTYISNSVSFLRVGAFALSHAVLSFIIFTMSDLVGGSLSAGGLVIGVFGNAIIIVLEGLIVTIQVVRLQYYEFFSKFFTETGKEFKPFRFKYKES